MAKSLFERIGKTVMDNGYLFLVLLLGIVFLGVYSTSKWAASVSGMDSGIDMSEEEKMLEESKASFEASKPLGTNEEYAKIEGITTSTAGLSQSCASVSTVDPSDLLPSDNTSEWAQMNPSGEGDVGNVNLLKAGYHNGINTVSGGAMRNSNLQLRSDPPIAKENVSPFLQSTIEPDTSRLGLEIAAR